MAVKKVKDVETKATEEVKNEVEVEVEASVEDTVIENEEVVAETSVEEVEVEASVEEKEEIEVDTKNAEVGNSAKSNGNVKIRMRVDHKCCIAMERYDLKAGKTYTVPANVKRILNDSGLLAPL